MGHLSLRSPVVRQSSISRLFERQLEGPSVIGESLAPLKAQEVWGLAMESAFGGDTARRMMFAGEDPGVFDSLLRL